MTVNDANRAQLTTDDYKMIRYLSKKIGRAVSTKISLSLSFSLSPSLSLSLSLSVSPSAPCHLCHLCRP